jgi:hypothetical protein
VLDTLFSLVKYGFGFTKIYFQFTGKVPLNKARLEQKIGCYAGLGGILQKKPVLGPI